MKYYLYCSIKVQTFSINYIWKGLKLPISETNSWVRYVKSSPAWIEIDRMVEPQGGTRKIM